MPEQSLPLAALPGSEAVLVRNILKETYAIYLVICKPETHNRTLNPLEHQLARKAK